MFNPFVIQEIPVNAPFCNRVKELERLASYARSNQSVVLYSPRRFGKTSLVKRVQAKLAQDGFVTIFVDFYGVSSIDEVAGRLARSVFQVTHDNDPLWKKALRFITAYRPVLKPSEDGMEITVETTRGPTEVELLDRTIESLGRFIREAGHPVNIAFDEFQEIVTLPDALKIEATLRKNIQEHQAAYFFIGSRRRVLLGMFNERQRPFFQSAFNFPLPPLPANEFAAFIAMLFAERKIHCTMDEALEIAEKVQCHPGYGQKLASCVFNLAAEKGAVTGKLMDEAYNMMLQLEKPFFEANLQGLSIQQKALLRAIAKEPTEGLFSVDFMGTHNLGSIGGVQGARKQLEVLDLIEKGEDGVWRVVDPAFAVWLRR